MRANTASASRADIPRRARRAAAPRFAPARSRLARRARGAHTITTPLGIPRLARGRRLGEHGRRHLLLPRRDAQDAEGLRHHLREQRRRDFRGVVLALRIFEHHDGDAARVVRRREAREIGNVAPGAVAADPGLLRGARLAGDEEARDGRRRAGAPLDDAHEDARDRLRRRLREDARRLRQRERVLGAARLDDLRHDVRLHELAAVGDDRRDPRQLQRVQGHFLAHRDLGVGERGPARQRPEDPGVLARQVDPGGLAHAEAAGALEQPPRAEPEADADDADVGGMLEDAAQRQRSVVVALRLPGSSCSPRGSSRRRCR